MITKDPKEANLKVIDEWLENQKKEFLDNYREVKLGGKGFASILGKFIVTTDFNKFSIISSDSLETQESFSIEFKKELTTFQFLTPDLIVFVGNDSKRLLLYSLPEKKVITEYKAPYTLSSCVHIQSPELFWVASRNTLIQLKASFEEAPKLEVKMSKTIKNASINDIAGNQKIIVTGNSDKSVTIFRIKSLQKKKELKSIHSGIYFSILDGSEYA